MKTISAKLYPTPTQERTLIRFMRVECWIHNKMLEQRIKAWKRRGESLSYMKQSYLLVGWRKRIDWIGNIPSAIARDALRRIDRGMKAFFRRLEAGQKPGFPRFKSSIRWRSFEILESQKYVRSSNRVYVPGVGVLPVRGLRQFEGIIKGLRVIRKARGWYVHLIVDDGPAPASRPVESTVGIDVGLTHFATLSTGEKIENPRWFQKQQRRLRFLQRIASRRTKGSKRRAKAYIRIASFQEKIVDTRKDWAHKLSRRLVNEFDLIAVEDLNVSGMSRGRCSKSIHDAAWSDFAWQLSYKAANAGGTFVRVNPRGTSQECSACGLTVPKTLKDRVHSCSCGCVLDRDENAALNVLARATREITPVENALAGPQLAVRRGSAKREGVHCDAIVQTGGGEMADDPVKCPRCGFTPDVTTPEESGDDYWYINCCDDDCPTDAHWGKSRQEAVDSWNEMNSNKDSAR